MQVGIALRVLKETHSKNVVTLLTRSGNSIGYASVERYLTTIASEVSKREGNVHVFVPSNTVHGHCAQNDDGNLDATNKTVYQNTKQGNNNGAENIYFHKTRQ